MTDSCQPSPPGLVAPLKGDERFEGVNASAREFWSWGFSDLRANVVRRVLAEFLVAQTVGAVQAVRTPWDAYDVLSPEEIRIEVKSSAYLQSWEQRRLSQITFGKQTGLAWDEKTGQRSGDRVVRADVFVFCLQTCRDPSAYDALNLSQWEFSVVKGQAVTDYGTRTAGLGFVREHSGALSATTT